MSRARLREALALRDSARATIVPLIEAHAARLEQLPEARWRVEAEAEAQARMHRSVAVLYDLDAVTLGAGGWIAAACAPLAAEVIRRLRPVLGDRAGIAVVLEQGAPGVTGIFQTIGPEEPDLFILRGCAVEVDPTLQSLAEFYGSVLVSLGSNAGGVVALPPGDLLDANSARGVRGWMYTTTQEVDSNADPEAVRSAIERMRGAGRET